ncbi:outer membrane protein Iml2/Tetratricopeptide repeat protein 39 [Gautieria morchelliformis]|nr:outer membrane protein Iml2/Tetratricopeptide repeat protein 39 [Gautieria morchelliformis]
MTAGDDIRHAGTGFDLLFSNELDAAKTHLSSEDSAFHLLGLGCVVFLQAALGMETGMMAEASRLLTSAEAKARKGAKASKTSPQTRRFVSGLDFEVLQADAVLLLGFTQALSESYTGYLQCMYSLNSAHSKFSKIYKTAFPDGIDKFATPSSTPVASRQPSLLDVPQTSRDSPTSITPPSSSASRIGLFSRWSSSSSKPASRATTPVFTEPDGPVEELIIAGAAFGYGLFNLVLSLLPAKVKGVVGFFGFNSDRSLGLRALAVAATKDDIHGVFAGLALMSYHGSVLLLSGYQADEAHILKQYKAIVDKLEGKYPNGSLWILNRAKILRMSYDPDGAISALQAGLAPERPHSFVQADALLVFDLAWTQLAQRNYQESADMFLRMTMLNTWSHATYHFIAAGCYLSLGNVEKARTILDNVPQLLDRIGRKIGGRDLPTEVFIRKKIAFYKQKQARRGSEADYAASIRISPAEELGLFWNVHDRITLSSAKAHIRDWTALSPPIHIDTPYVSSPKTPPDNEHLVDLDTPDELALRSLLLGVVHRSISHFREARAFLLDVAKHPVEAKWMNALALFELAVLHLKEAEASDKADADLPDTAAPSESSKALWNKALKEAEGMLDQASEASANTDLISLLRDEIMLKQKRGFC